MTYVQTGLQDDLANGIIRSGADSARANALLDKQLIGALKTLGPGIFAHVSENSFKVTAGVGLSVSIAAGAGAAKHSTYGAAYLQTGGTSTLSGLAASSVLYVFASIEVSGGNDSRKTATPLFVTALSDTLDGGLLLAKITTTGSAVTVDADLRRNATPLRFLGAHSATTPYLTGDVVSSANALWRARIDNTAVTPVAGATWELVLQGADTEAIQDIAGAMLVDSTTLDFTYNDGAGTETAEVKANSITLAHLVSTLISGATAETTSDNADAILIHDDSANAIRKMTRLNFLSGLLTNPMTTLGDLIYGAASGVATRLAGNITTTVKVLSQVGNGSVSAAPSWLSATDAATASTLVMRDASGRLKIADGVASGDAVTVAQLSAAVAGLLDFKSDTDASGNPNYPAASKGDAYIVTVAGKIGGASGVVVDVGDLYVAKADNAGGTQASVGTSWFVLEKNLAGALLAANNLSDLANAATARNNLGLGTAAVIADNTLAHLAGTETITGLKTFQNYLALDDSSPSQITANQNNYDAGTAPVVRLSTDASRTLTGIVAQTDALRIIRNVGSFDIVLANESASSTAANRISVPSGSDLTLAAKASALLWYDGTTARWAVLATWATGSGSGTSSAVSRSITQAAHGLAVKKVVRLSGGVFLTASQINAAAAEAIGMVSVVTDANTFTLVTHGYVTGLSGLVADSVYFLGTSGDLTLSPPTTAGYISKPVFVADSTTSGYFINWRGTEVGTSEVPNNVCDGRLTLTSGTPVTTADVTGASTIYFTPFKGNRISLYDATGVWKTFEFTERSLALSGMTTDLPYDVFIYNNAGTLTLEKLAWTNATTRATAITLQQGVYVKSGDSTRRYLGSFRATGATTTADATGNRRVDNCHNRVLRRLRVAETAGSWTYNSATLRAANANNANRVEVMIGIADRALRLQVWSHVTAPADPALYVGIGEDSTTAQHADQIGGYGTSNGTAVQAVAMLECNPAIGGHYYQWLESVTAAVTHTFYSGSGYRQGMIGSIEM